MAVKSSADKACGLGLVGITVDGTDVFKVYQVVSEAVDRARSGQGPTVVEARMYRITPHSSDDDDRAYRSREEVEEHKRQDPLLVARVILEKENILTPKVIDEMEARAKEMVDEAVGYAEQAPYPSPEEGRSPVYAEEVQHA